MKRLATVLVIVAFAGLFALPKPAAAGVQFGLKAGANIAKPTGADVEDPEYTIEKRIGFTGGIFLAFNLSKALSIQTEVLYTMKGADYTAVDDSYSGKLYADYLEIPLLLKITFFSGGLRPFIFAGPSVGFKLNEKLEEDGVPLTEELFKDNDYGAIFGAGLQLGRSFFIDVRYSLGLQKVIDADIDWTNGVWAATIGIGF